MDQASLSGKASRLTSESPAQQKTATRANASRRLNRDESRLPIFRGRQHQRGPSEPFEPQEKPRWPQPSGYNDLNLHWETTLPGEPRDLRADSRLKDIWDMASSIESRFLDIALSTSRAVPKPVERKTLPPELQKTARILDLDRQTQKLFVSYEDHFCRDYRDRNGTSEGERIYLAASYMIMLGKLNYSGRRYQADWIQQKTLSKFLVAAITRLAAEETGQPIKLNKISVQELATHAGCLGFLQQALETLKVRRFTLFSHGPSGLMKGLRRYHTSADRFQYLSRDFGCSDTVKFKPSPFRHIVRAINHLPVLAQAIFATLDSGVKVVLERNPGAAAENFKKLWYQGRFAETAIVYDLKYEPQILTTHLRNLRHLTEDNSKLGVLRDRAIDKATEASRLQKEAQMVTDKDPNSAHAKFNRELATSLNQLLGEIEALNRSDEGYSPVVQHLSFLIYIKNKILENDPDIAMQDREHVLEQLDSEIIHTLYAPEITESINIHQANLIHGMITKGERKNLKALSQDEYKILMDQGGMLPEQIAEFQSMSDERLLELVSILKESEYKHLKKMLPEDLQKQMLLALDCLRERIQLRLKSVIKNMLVQHMTIRDIYELVSAPRSFERVVKAVAKPGERVDIINLDRLEVTEAVIKSMILAFTAPTVAIAAAAATA